MNESQPKGILNYSGSDSYKMRHELVFGTGDLYVHWWVCEVQMYIGSFLVLMMIRRVYMLFLSPRACRFVDLYDDVVLVPSFKCEIQF